METRLHMLILLLFSCNYHNHYDHQKLRRSVIMHVPYSNLIGTNYADGSVFGVIAATPRVLFQLMSG